MSSLKGAIIFTVFLFSLFSLTIFYVHEQQAVHLDKHEASTQELYVRFMADSGQRLQSNLIKMWNDTSTAFMKEVQRSSHVLTDLGRRGGGGGDYEDFRGGGEEEGGGKADTEYDEDDESEEEEKVDGRSGGQQTAAEKNRPEGGRTAVVGAEEDEEEEGSRKRRAAEANKRREAQRKEAEAHIHIPAEDGGAVPDQVEHEVMGSLVCGGRETHSEVIYWKVVPGDATFESPITPHHDAHDDRYLTFEYDNGGWNNMRMGIECAIVAAHAMGRTIVLPPSQSLYLLTQKHRDDKNANMHSEMGFEDFFNIDILQSHRGFHVITMHEFLEREAKKGLLKGVYPPRNSSDIFGQELWRYMESVADEMPAWMGHFLAMPDHPGDYEFKDVKDGRVLERMKRFGGDRSPVYYEKNLREAHHLHVPGRDKFRLLQHHYAMQSFYKRFIRDFMRYRDEIQCLGHELVAAVREDARASGSPSGDYYSLHIRRGDFQYKDVKLTAAEIVKNLHVNGQPIIPPGSLVYISTDDPDGVCKGCFAQRQSCTTFAAGSKPVGCPEDPSWKGFVDFGWKIRFLKDYLAKGYLKDSNPNVHGMVESIVCSRSKAFAGTWFSTFTGYIHRLRGYHGLGEATYYHSNGHVLHAQSPKSVGHGFAREWRAGWTDDAGELI